MPIEIREIVIRATVNQGDASAPQPGAAAAGSAASQDVLQECIEQIVQVIQDKNER
jgi:hypothetical protein